MGAGGLVCAAPAAAIDFRVWQFEGDEGVALMLNGQAGMLSSGGLAIDLYGAHGG